MLLVIQVKVFSQNETDEQLGYFYDWNGEFIDGSADIDYDPEKILEVNYTKDEIKSLKGYYFTKNGKRVDGDFIGFRTYGSFKFRKEDSKKRRQYLLTAVNQ